MSLSLNVNGSYIVRQCPPDDKATRTQNLCFHSKRFSCLKRDVRICALNRCPDIDIVFPGVTR